MRCNNVVEAVECGTNQGKRAPWLDWSRLIPCLNPPARAVVADLAAGKPNSVLELG